ncbi:MAG TPA: 30S ribosome-binding factor RbfA [Anaeromyxobacteraceae bacterium]|nr:30S ribosome-binding factor RbfA [Anaeromyxobacteraceae bacterium]
MTGSNRPARVASEFQHEVSRVLARGLKDPRITGFVTVTGAKMSPDLREATVYVSIHGDDRTREGTLEGLRAAAGYLQREVSHALKLRHTPHLRFVYDESIERGDRMNRLIREAREKDAAVPPAEPGSEPDPST